MHFSPRSRRSGPTARTSRRFELPGFSAVALGLLAACGEEGGAGPPAGGSAGMDSPDFAVAPEWESLWTVGALDGEDWEVFGDVTDLVFNQAGDLFVLDEQAGHVVVFDRAGAHLRTISRQGEGPGELTEPRSMALLADGRLAVFDRSRRGIQFFTQEGEYLESVPFDPQRGMPSFVRGWLPDGSILTNSETRITSTADGGMSFSTNSGAAEAERPIIRYGPDGGRGVWYTAWDPPPPTGEGVSTEGAIQLTMRPVRAFDPSLSFVPLRDGRLAIVDSVDYRIKLVDEAGTVADVLERPVRPIPVTDAIRDAEREWRLDQLDGPGVRLSSPLGGSLPLPSGFQEQMTAARRTTIEQMQFAEAIPAIDDLALDFEGRLWVERRGLPGEEGSIDIVTPDARYLGTIQSGGLRIPDAFGPDGLMAYGETHDLGFPIVRVVRLTPAVPLEAGSSTEDP
ncbi:6-bladed beta-propeller [Candidatus Palauibacter sp.]|uniref:6-bladed beta-propeller n=1 Tax=Candidatus Palauibacter sp. TaxID=3101350 RepID=UPI003B51D705